MRMGATLAVDPARARPPRRPARARHGRGLRRRARDVGQPGGAPRGASATWPTAAASRSSASRPRRSALDVNEIVFKMLTLRGIYGREMYETWYKMTVMLQSGLDITPGDHPPLRVPRPRGGVRRRPLGRLRQGHPRLGRPRRTPRRPHDDRDRPPRPARLPRRRARRAPRAAPLPAAAGHVVGAGPDRLGRRPAGHQPLVERLPRPDPPPADARGGDRGGRASSGRARAPCARSPAR